MLEEAGVDWRKMTEEDQGERIAYSPLKLATGRRGERRRAKVVKVD